MSNTKGSLLISNANAVGTALITKLGGTGYKPSEWSDAVNIMGIASADIPTALANITEGSYTGSDRGSIKISNLNLVGSMLNKKFNTDRGFKPNEWESAISKLTPLEIKTASGAIASFADGADGVPVKSCSVSFLPSGGGGTPQNPISVHGVSGLSVTRTGKNLLDMTVYDGGSYNPAVGNTITLSLSASQFTKTGNAYTIDTTTSWKTFSVRMPVKSGVTYYRKFTMSASGTNLGSSEYYLDSDNKVIGSVSNNTDNPHTKTGTLSVPSGAVWFVITFTNRGTSTNTLTITEPQIEVGSTTTTYSPYVTPSVVTDTFGQTIYGGTRDLTTDKASVTSSAKIKFNDDSLTWTYQSNYSRFRCASVTSLIKKPQDNQTILDGLLCSCYVAGKANSSYASPLSIAVNNSGEIFVYDSNYTDVTTWLNNIGNEEFIYPLHTTTEITGLTPHEIDTLYGDNNIFADTGTTTVEYRADIDLALNA